MRRRNLAVLVSLSLMGTMSMTGYAASEKETTTEAASTEAGSTEAESKSADQEAADKVADLIDAIYVQERNDNTDEQCKEAKEAWDALTDAQKERTLIRITSEEIQVMLLRMIRETVMRSVRMRFLL